MQNNTRKMKLPAISLLIVLCLAFVAFMVFTIFLKNVVKDDIKSTSIILEPKSGAQLEGSVDSPGQAQGPYRYSSKRS